MPTVNIEAISSLGVIKETPAHRLPPEAWTNALNMRFVDSRAQRFEGDTPVMDPPSVPPGFIMSVDNGGDVFWVYAEAGGAGSKVYAFNSGSHADISQMGDYNIPNYRDMNGDIFQGVPIFNYSNGTPQYWPMISLGDPLEDLPGWPANTKAKVIRAFGNFMVAMNIEDGDGAHFHRVLWSDSAGPGEMPIDWDPTNIASDSDQRELSDINSGQIVDGIALRDFFVIGKNESLWVMRYIGGQDIMSVKPQMTSVGVFAPRCMKAITIAKSKLEIALMMTGDDFGTFDGQDFLSVVEDKDRKFLAADIDPINYQNSFILDNRAQDEAWFCYPENGEVDPSMACVWNYKENTITFREFQGTCAANGPVEGASNETWATVVGSWEDQGPAKWQESSRKKVVVGDPENTRLVQLEAGTTFSGTNFTSVLERTGLAVTGQDRQGNPIVNYKTRKIIHRVWPKCVGGPVLIQLGGADTPNPDDVVWQPGVIFDPSTGARFCDPAGDDAPMNCVYNAIRFTWFEQSPGRMEGYAIEVEELSEI